MEKNFYRHKTPILFRDLDTEKVLASKKIPFGEKDYKYFIGCLYNYHKVRPLHIMLPKTSAYIKMYDGCIFWLKMMTY